jgi:signal peptidase I
MGIEEGEYDSRASDAPSGDGNVEGAAATSSRSMELPPPSPKPRAAPRRRRQLAVAALAVLGVVSLVAARRLFEAFDIASGSMQPTLLAGDRVLTRRWSVTPVRGDVVSVRFPERPTQPILERVVGLPGDELEVLDGHLLVNHLPVPECHVGTYRVGEQSAELYVEFDGIQGRGVLHTGEHAWLRCDTQWDCAGGCFSGYCARKQLGPWVVGPDEVWTMSDDRGGGRGRAVPRSAIRGVAIRVLASSIEVERTWLPIDPPQLGAVNAGLRERLEKCLADGPPPPPSERGRDSVAL